jgi:hypothetical protein
MKRRNVAYWPLTDISMRPTDVRFGGRADIRLGSPNVCK